MPASVKIEGLAEFRRALRSASDASPRELSAALRRAGEPIVARAATLAPRRSGALAGSYAPRVSGLTAQIASRVPYGPGAEWGTRGKFAGFTRYGAPGSRFAGRALEETSDEVARIVEDELRDIAEIHGWAR